MFWLKPLTSRGEASAGDNNDTQVAWMRVAGDAVTKAQVAEARKLFAIHLDTISLSLAGYHTVDYKLPDGSRLRIVSNSGVHHAVLWPVGAPREDGLPHGFLVVSGWAPKRIFKRRPTETPVWKLDATIVPQAAKDIEADNHVFRSTGGTPPGYFHHPMVLTETGRSLWDYAKRTVAAMASASTVMPVCTLYGTGPYSYTTRNVHFGIDNALYNSAGTAIYTMSVVAAILVSPETPETPIHAPPATTAAGTHTVLQHVRMAITSPSTGVYQARFANERLSQTGAGVYVADERNEVTLSGPFGAASAGGGSSSASLGETIGSTELFMRYGTSTLAGSGGHYTWVEGFQYGDTSLAGFITTTEDAFSEVGTFTSSGTSHAKTLALPEVSSVAYPDLVVETNVGGSMLWRAGYYKQISDPGLPPISTTRWFGNYGYRKDRIDAEYTLTTAPVSKYQLGWTDYKLFEGLSSGECTGQTYVDTRYAGRSLSWWDGYYFLRTYIVPLASGTYLDHLADVEGWLASVTIKPAVVAYVSDFPVGFSAPANTIATTVANNRPVNTGSYQFKSRYVLDYDHKGRFLAALRVEVTCSGAEWREDAGIYEGFMTEFAEPSYTIAIYFESNWNGVTASTLLASASGARPAFEFATITKQNPYYYLFPAEVTKQDMLVRVPPMFGVPFEAMSQMPALMTHQGANPRLACSDMRPDITGADVARTQSTRGIEFSSATNGVKPPGRYVTGQLYARTFRLSDFPDALWLLRSTKCDAKENDGSTGASYFYFPTLPDIIANQVFHVEVRDGVHEQWSDELPGTAPAPEDRDIKLYRV